MQLARDVTKLKKWEGRWGLAVERLNRGTLPTSMPIDRAL